MDIQGVDPESLLLILRLQLADLRATGHGGNQDGEGIDRELASQAFQAELQELARFTVDQIVSRGVAQAGDQDAEIIDEATIDTPGPLHMAEDVTLNTSDAESFTTAAEGITTCIACGDTASFDNVAYCRCGHDYCPDCITNLFQTAITQEALFPPRCCNRRIRLYVAGPFLPESVIEEYLLKREEYRTPDPTYCHRPTCSTFIPLTNSGWIVATCPQCQDQTCRMCKCALHAGPCPRDEAAEDVLRLGAENGWQQCWRCQRMVELDHGCNHMSKCTYLCFHAGLY